MAVSASRSAAKALTNTSATATAAASAAEPRFEHIYPEADVVASAGVPTRPGALASAYGPGPGPGPGTSSAPKLKLSLGMAVEVNYRGKGRWFRGVVASVRPDGTYDVKFADEEVEVQIAQDKIRPF